MVNASMILLSAKNSVNNMIGWALVITDRSINRWCCEIDIREVNALPHLPSRDWWRSSMAVDASVTLAIMTPAIMAESLGIRMTERKGCQVKVLLHIVGSNANTTAKIWLCWSGIQSLAWFVVAQLYYYVLNVLSTAPSTLRIVTVVMAVVAIVVLSNLK